MEDFTVDHGNAADSHYGQQSPGVEIVPRKRAVEGHSCAPDRLEYVSAQDAAGNVVHSQIDGCIVLYGDAPSVPEPPQVRVDAARGPGALDSLSRLIQRLVASPSLASRKQLLLGLHQRMWHAPEARLLPILKSAGCPVSILKEVPGALKSCSRCR